MVGFCERGDGISFSTNAGNFLTSLGTTVLAFQEGVCCTGVALYGTPVHNRKPPATFATTHIRCLYHSDKAKSQQCCKAVANRVSETTCIFLHFEKKRVVIRNANIQG